MDGLDGPTVATDDEELADATTTTTTAISITATTTGATNTLVSLQIPQNAEVGDTLSFVVDGQCIELIIPPGSEPGEYLEIQLANSKHRHISGDDDNDDEDDDEEDSPMTEAISNKNNNYESDDYVTFRTSSGDEIVVATTTTTTTTMTEEDGNQTRLGTNEGGLSTSTTGRATDGTHSLIWPATRYALQFLTSPHFRNLLHDTSLSSSTPIRSILELGSGHHGLFGMAYAAEMVSHGMSNHDSTTTTTTTTTTPMIIKVTLTDVPDAMVDLKSNIDRNLPWFQQHNCDVTAIPLVWHTQPIPSSTHCELDWIIGSDVLYRTSTIPSLVATMLRLLSPTTRILLSVRWRKPNEERIFFQLLNDHIEWKVIHGICSLDHNEYGNPSCYESNKFFSQTMVSVNGQPTPLANIIMDDDEEEQQLEQMTSKEFEQYENFQTQIYLGCPIVRNQSLKTGKVPENTTTTTSHRPKRPRMDLSP